MMEVRLGTAETRIAHVESRMGAREERLERIDTKATLGLLATVLLGFAVLAFSVLVGLALRGRLQFERRAQPLLDRVDADRRPDSAARAPEERPLPPPGLEDARRQAAAAEGQAKELRREVDQLRSAMNQLRAEVERLRSQGSGVGGGEARSRSGAGTAWSGLGGSSGEVRRAPAASDEAALFMEPPKPVVRVADQARVACDAVDLGNLVWPRLRPLLTPLVEPLLVWPVRREGDGWVLWPEPPDDAPPAAVLVYDTQSGEACLVPNRPRLDPFLKPGDYTVEGVATPLPDHEITHVTSLAQGTISGDVYRTARPGVVRAQR